VTLKRSLKVIQLVPFKNLGVVSYSPSIVTVTISLTLYSASKNSATLKSWLGVVQAHLKMAPFDRPHTTFYWSAIVTIALSCTVFELFEVE